MNVIRVVGTSLAAATLLAVAGCSPSYREVKRVPADAVVDVDYGFNDTDARIVWQQMSDDAAFRGWSDRWIQEHGGQRPIIIIGPIKNNTQELINMNLFTRNFEREMLNSGKVRVVSARDDRGELRDERLQGQEWNSPETRKIVKNELGADLMLLGDINDVQQRSLSGRTVSKYFQVNLDLTNIESNEKVWIGSAEVKKVSTDK